MERGRAESEFSGRRFTGGVGLLGSLFALAFGVRVSAAIARTTLGRCVLAGRCDGIIDAALQSPGTTLLGLTVIAVSGIPLFLWLRDARGSAQHVAELSDLTRKAIGYFGAGFAVLAGTFLFLEGTAWWAVSAGIALWIIGYVVVMVSFRGARRAQALYVLAVIGFPVLMSLLLAAPVVS